MLRRLDSLSVRGCRLVQHLRGTTRTDAQFGDGASTSFVPSGQRIGPQKHNAKSTVVCYSPILFSNSGSRCQALHDHPCRAHCSLRGRGLPSARWRKTTLADQCCKRGRPFGRAQKIGRSHHRHRPDRDDFSRRVAGTLNLVISYACYAAAFFVDQLNSVRSIHMRCRMTASLRAAATVAFRYLWCREPELLRWEGQCMGAVGEP